MYHNKRKAWRRILTSHRLNLFVELCVISFLSSYYVLLFHHHHALFLFSSSHFLTFSILHTEHVSLVAPPPPPNFYLTLRLCSDNMRKRIVYRVSTPFSHKTAFKKVYCCDKNENVMMSYNGMNGYRWRRKRSFGWNPAGTLSTRQINDIL